MENKKLNSNIKDMENYLSKWQRILRLLDWDIKIELVEKEWRKTGDIKIDSDDKTAILLINVFNPKQTNLEELIIHELLHLKLWDLDQLTESLIDAVFCSKEDDIKKELVHTNFMQILECTVNDLAKSFLLESGDDKSISYGRLEKIIKDELGE